jgi:predicted HicB family RNase H-like nuclease
MAAKKRITLEVDAEFQRRLKITTASKGISIREYCERAIGKELDKDEAMEPKR